MHDVLLVLIYLSVAGLLLAAIYQAFLSLDELIHKARDASRRALPQPHDEVIEE